VAREKCTLDARNDPLVERTTWAPLELDDPDNGIEIKTWEFPEIDYDPTSAGSADTEGDPIASLRPKNFEPAVTLKVQEPTTAAATNLITNPSFEVDTTGWATSGGFWLNSGATLSRISTQSYAGDFAAQVVTTNALTSEGIKQDIAFTNGVTYAVIVAIKGASGGETVRVNIGGAGVGNNSNTDLTLTTGWQVFTTSFTATGSGTASVAIRTASAQAATFYVDAVRVSTSTATSYFDGDTVGCEWTGTRHASTSTRSATGGDRFQAILRDIQTKVAKLAAEKGTLRRTLASGDQITFDVEKATVKIPSDWYFTQRSYAEVELKFECRPYGRGALQTYGSNTESSLPCLVFTAGTVAGNVPGLGKLVITDAQGQDQWWAAYGLQSRFYDGGTTAKLHYEAEELLPLGGAVTQARAGASGGTTVRQGTLTTSYQAMLSTAYLAGTVHQQHVGDYRVWARLYRPTTNAGTVTVALEWGQGDFQKRTVNDAVIYDVDDREGDFTLADLGLVNLKEPAQGAKRWEGRVLGKSSTTGDDLEVDDLMLFPVGEGYGQVSSNIQSQNPTSFSARDEFDQSAGALAGKTLPAGGTWAGAGDTDDFAVEATGHTAQRTIGSDGGSTDPYAGRYGIAGTTTLTATTVQVDLARSPVNAFGGTFDLQGVLARYTDTNNWLMAVVTWAGAVPELAILKRVSGTATQITSAPLPLPRAIPQPLFATGVFYTVRLMVDAGGRFLAWFGQRGASLSLLATGVDSALATGGALASGKVGIYDAESAATPTGFTRIFDNFSAFVPTADAAIFASQSLEIRHDRATREDSTGTYWNDKTIDGDYLRVPPAGREGRTTRIIVKGSRNDPDTMNDTAIDDLTAQLYVVPRYLVVPPP
jgi:hypothetical protein